MMTGTSIIMYPWVHNVDLIHLQSKVKKIFDQYILMIILQLKMLEAKQKMLQHLNISRILLTKIAVQSSAI